jgi:CRP-like cAMP-binding protein
MTTGMVTRRWEHPSERSFWMSLEPAEREAYAAVAEEQVFPSGTILCQEGTCSTHVLVITSGWATVAVHGQIVTVRAPEDLIGERAALTRLSRSATVSALGDVTGLVMPAWQFHALTEENPRILVVLETQERERLAEDDHQRRHAPATVEHRLAGLLYELAFRRGERTPNGPTLSLPISRQEIARWVDAEADEVNRVLKAWRRRGMISMARQRLTVVDARRLGQLHQRRPEVAFSWSSLNCSIFFTDVAGFSAACRNESDRQVVRDALYEILRQSFEESGVPWTACYHEDRGDGVLVVVPPTVPTRAVTDPLLALLTAGLRRHNRRASAAVRIQLRAALHVGPVSRDKEGLNGDAIIHTARLLDAPPLRQALRAAEADLAFIASNHVFDTVIRHAPGLVDPDLFRSVRFRVKESEMAAWMYVSGSTIAPTSTAKPAGAREEIAAPSSVTHFHEAVRVDGDLIMGNKVIGQG